MSKYSSILYDQSYYGQKSRLAFSVAPFTATALNYTTIQLNWSAPLGGYTAFRLVRNQDGYAETVEDGAIVYEEFGIDGTSGTVSISTILDQETDGVPPLIGGRFVYYRVWILKSTDSVWYPAGDCYTLLPNQHPTYGIHGNILETTHDKVMNYLPKVFTSASQSPGDEVNQDSDLYRFLQGFSFTLDEFLTMADSLLPDFSGRRTSPNIIASKAAELNLTDEPLISIKHQKRMIREAIYMYRHKGTVSAIETLVESLTGYATTVSVSPNIMLSNEDSTFHGGLGNWLPIGNCTLTLENVNPVTSVTNSIDRVYSAKVVTSAANCIISNGANAPVTSGIPVVAAEIYTFSFYSQTASSTNSITPKIYWYDYSGTLISSDSGTAHTASTTWSQGSMTATAPDGAVYASVELKFASAKTQYVDMLQFAKSTVAEYNEARAAYVFLYPKKNNYISNPSFENDLSSWTITTGTATRVLGNATNHDLTGAHAMKLVAGAVNFSTAVPAGIAETNSYLTLSAYSQAQTTGTNTANFTLNISASLTALVLTYSVTSGILQLDLGNTPALNIGDTVVLADIASGLNGTHVIAGFNGSSPQFVVSSGDVSQTSITGTITKTISASGPATATTDWTRSQLRMFIPPEWNPSQTSVTVGVTGTLAHDVLFDAFQLEPNYLATDYFDGAYGTERDALWAGTPNASNSYGYPNKIVNISRLSEELPNFLPYDTPYIISSYAGIEASGISQ
jgi:hypothetical protein